MTYNPDIHHRRSIRLQGYDYSGAGAYFITICTQNRECLFGNIIVGATPRGCPVLSPRGCPIPTPRAGPEMVLNPAGAMVQTVWDEIPIHYTGTEIDEFVVMPNHIHGIIIIGAGNMGSLSLGDIVHRFKTMTTKRYAVGNTFMTIPAYGNRIV
jgi:putative transposase